MYGLASYKRRPLLRTHQHAMRWDGHLFQVLEDLRNAALIDALHVVKIPLLAVVSGF